MSTARDRDLERWEQGELSMSELVALHGSDGAAGLVLLHRRMSALGTAPVGDPETVWRVIRERLPDLAGHRRTRQLRRSLTRPLAIAAAAVLIAGTAYAASPDAVQRYLTSFWHAVQSILDVDVPSNGPADTHRPSQGGGQGDAPAVVDDPDDGDGGEANEHEDGPGDTSEGDDGDDGETGSGDGETGSGDDEGTGGDDEGDESDDDDAEDPEDDDEPEDDGDEPEDDDDEPGNDEDDPDGSGGGDDEDD